MYGNNVYKNIVRVVANTMVLLFFRGSQILNLANLEKKDN